MKRLWLVLLGFLVYVVMVVVAGLLLHLVGLRMVIFNALLLLLGVAALAVTLWYLKRLEPKASANNAELDQLTALVRDADNKLKQGNRPALKSLAAMPLLYVIGEDNSAKTQTVLQSGLDPELLAGQVYRDGAVAPTQTVNLWLTGSVAVVEAGGPLLRQPDLWQRLVRLTAPGKLGTALSKSALQPTRAVVLCVSLERMLAPSTADSMRDMARTLNERLREVSRTLGISLPVYVLFTKLDKVSAFAEYVANLSTAEIGAPLGSVLTETGVGAGLYAERAAEQIGARYDELTYLLSEFRLELLARGGDAATLARSYEFPRDLRKLRTGIVDFLVEVGRPSQLGVNPYLRGFFFSGMRAHIVEDVQMDAAAHLGFAPAVADAGATQVFSVQQMRAAAQPVPRATNSSRKIAQWAFLPYLFSGLILKDTTALESSRKSTRVSGTKRLLAVLGCALLLGYLCLLTISFFRNRSLEQRAADAATRVQPVGAAGVASEADLRSLDALRVVLVELDGYHRDGAPLMSRWGLYRGEQTRAAACRAYGNRFRTLLLSQTQGNIVARLSALPVKAAPTDEYQTTYKPLKAWLITTSNPEKSTAEFLPPVLQAEWMGQRNISAQTQALALNQFEYYAASLAEPGSCLAGIGGEVQAPLVANTRGYLNTFSGLDHVYLSMKSAADRKFGEIDFKKMYPASVKFVTAPTVVEGAFSKTGFSFMQDAINHPDLYLNGEEWVTGPVTSSLDRGTLRQQLSERYQGEFLSSWRTFLKTARVLPFASMEDAAAKLHELDGPASPLLQILGVVARNTTVADPASRQPFQAPQSIIPTAEGPMVNPGYTEKLGALEQAIHQMLSSPANGNDPSGVNAAAAAAYQAVSTLRGGFQPPDPAGVADANSERLLREPITAAEDLAGKAPTKAANGAGADFCKATSAVLGKFPFNPEAKQDASPEEAAAFFSPSGPIAQFTAAQSKLIAYNGAVYTAASGVPVNPALLNFLNATKTVSTILFPNGSTQPSLSFAMTQEATPNLAPAAVDIDGASFSNVGTPNRVAWQYRSQGSVKLAGSGQTKNNFGPWSIFHFAYSAKHPSPNRLEYIFQNNGVTEKSQTGVDVVYRFDVDDAGSRLLNPDFMRRQLRCVSTVAK